MIVTAKLQRTLGKTKVEPPGGTRINIYVSQTHQLPEEVSGHLHVPMSPGLQDVVYLTITPLPLPPPLNSKKLM